MRFGLGANLFYNSPMEACVIICRTRKPEERRGKILFINAVDEVTRERAQSFLTEANQAKILDAYRSFADKEDFSRVVSLDEIRAKDGNLNISLYVRKTVSNGNAAQGENSLAEAIAGWEESSTNLRAAMNDLFTTLEQNI